MQARSKKATDHADAAERGVLFLAGKSLYQDRRLQRRIATACRETSETGIYYYTGEAVPTAFATGFLHPRIYLPAGLTPQEKRYILLHEQAHLMRKDPWRKAALYFAACLHWYNPIVWVAYRRMEYEMEAACDEAVMQRIGKAERPAFCRTLFGFALHSTAFSQLAFGEGKIKMRIQNILGYQKCGAKAIGGAVALVCLVGGVYTVPVSPARKS